MGEIHNLAKRLNNYVNDLPRTIERVINVDVAEELELLEKEQLQSSKMPDGSAITNKETGQPDYAPSYAAYKSMFYPASFGDGKPNMFLTGDLYKNIDIKAKNNQYRYFSPVSYAPALSVKYGDFLGGLAPFKHQKAQSITTKAIAKDFKRKVFKK